jgi:hypothetical protein
MHECGHNASIDDLSAHHHEALCRIGTKMFLLARQNQLA